MTMDDARREANGIVTTAIAGGRLAAGGEIDLLRDPDALRERIAQALMQAYDMGRRAPDKRESMVAPGGRRRKRGGA